MEHSQPRQPADEAQQLSSAKSGDATPLSRSQLDYLQLQNLKAVEFAQQAVQDANAAADRLQTALALQQHTSAAVHARQQFEESRLARRSARSSRAGSPPLEELPTFGRPHAQLAAEQTPPLQVGRLGMLRLGEPGLASLGEEHGVMGNELGIASQAVGTPGLGRRGGEPTLSAQQQLQQQQRQQQQASVIGIGLGTSGLSRREGEPMLTVQQQQQYQQQHQQPGTIGHAGTSGLVSRDGEPMLTEQQSWQQQQQLGQQQQHRQHPDTIGQVGTPGLGRRGGQQVFGSLFGTAGRAGYYQGERASGKGIDKGARWGLEPSGPAGVRGDAALWAYPEKQAQWGEAGAGAGLPPTAADFAAYRTAEHPQFAPPPPPPPPPAFVTPPPPPPPRPVRSEWSAAVQRARQLIAAAAAVGENLTLAEALAISQAKETAEHTAAITAAAWHPTPVRAAAPARTTQDRLNAVEKTMTSFDGSGNVYDFIYKVEQKFEQQGVVAEFERHALLSAKLTGKAFTAMRNNALACATFDGTLAFLREMYGPSVAGVKAQLLALKFHPHTETARQFNERFNAIAGTAPAGSVAMGDLKATYLQALGRGDEQLMKDAIWYGDTDEMSLSRIQRTLVQKLDNFSILSSAALAGGPSTLTAAYKPVAFDDTVSAVGSDVATASSTIAELMKAVQAAKVATLPQSRPYMPPAAVAPPAAPPAASAAATTPARAWAETRTCHLCKKVGHLANNCPARTERRSQMVNKAVGLVLDHLDRENQAAEAAQDAPAVPYAAAGCTMPGFAIGASAVPAQAVHALKDWQQTTTPEQQGAVASSFATALAQYCFANPADHRATLYMEKVQGLGEAALQEMVESGETGLVNRILAERRRTVGTQAGERGVAEDLWPGITDTLGALPAKTNVFEWLKESQKFCVSVIELAMEIAMDNGWRIDYQRMEEEMTRARGSRAFGQYAADARAKARLHGAEGGRIISGRAAAQAAAKPTRWDVPPAPMEDAPIAEPSYVVSTAPPALVAAAYSFEAARANAQRDFGVVEDLTSLSGPPTPHLIVQVVLCFNGRAVKVTAIRDTGSPDTIMTRGLYQHVGMTGGTKTERTFTGLGAQPSAFAGVCGALEVRLTPKITVTNPCYISPDTYCLFILGNDIFNKERVETLSQNDQSGVFLLRYENTLDVLPYQLMSQEERQKREAAFIRPAAGDSSLLMTAYERNAKERAGVASATELVVASQAAQAAIAAGKQPVPSHFHLAVSDFPRLEAAGEMADVQQGVDRVAYEAAAAAIEDSFLEMWG